MEKKIQIKGASLYLELPYPVWQLWKFKKILLALKQYFKKEILWILYIFVKLRNCSLEVAVFVLLCHEPAAEFSAKKLSSKNPSHPAGPGEESPCAGPKGQVSAKYLQRER